MNKNTFVKRVMVGGGCLFLCVAPRLTLGQSNAPAAAPAVRMKPTPVQGRTQITPTEYLAGLTLTNDQKAKINKIREDTESHLATVARDQKLAPEVKEAMIGGYKRIENSKIFAVLTPEQQQQVRKRIATLRAAAQQPQRPGEQAPAPANQ